MYSLFIVLITIAVLPLFVWVVAELVIDIIQVGAKFHDDKPIVFAYHSVFLVLRYVSECHAKEFGFHP